DGYYASASETAPPPRRARASGTRRARPSPRLRGRPTARRGPRDPAGRWWGRRRAGPGPGRRRPAGWRRRGRSRPGRRGRAEPGGSCRRPKRARRRGPGSLIAAAAREGFGLGAVGHAERERARRVLPIGVDDDLVVAALRERHRQPRVAVPPRIVVLVGAGDARPHDEQIRV